MAEGVFVKRNGGLWPADPEAAAIMRSMADGREALCSVRVPRSVKQNKFVHALLHEIVKHTDSWRDVDDLKDYLKIRTRMYRLRVLPDGSTVLDLQRTAFGSMDQITFGRVWDRWKWVIVNEIVPGMDDRELKMRVLEQIT